MAAYHAFISYSHDADGLLAPSLQHGLQRLARPWRKRRALEVFRDRTGLAVTPHLWDEITVALAQAQWFVLLASPESAQSTWVNQEIEFFLAQDPTARDRILPVVTGGVWNWAGDGEFTEDSTSVPLALRGVFAQEPKYGDLRWARGQTDLDLQHPTFRDSVADIAATIHGRSKDELVGEDVRQFRIAKRMRRAAVGGLAVLTVAALVASVVAVQQRNVAQDNAAEARSRELTVTALGLVDEDPAVAALLSVESLYPNGRSEPLLTDQAVNAVGATSRAFLAQVFRAAGGVPGATGQFLVAVNDQFVATAGFGSESGIGEEFCPEFRAGAGVPSPILWWDRTTGERVEGVPAGATYPTLIQFENGVFRVDDGATLTPIVSAPVGEIQCDPGAGKGPWATPATFDERTGLVVALDEASNDFVAFDPVTGAEKSRMSDPENPDSPVYTADGSVGWSSVAVVGDLVVATSSFAEAASWSLSEGGDVVERVPAEAPLAVGGNLLYTGPAVFDVAADDEDADEDEEAKRLGLADRFDEVGAARFSADGRFLALFEGSLVTNADDLNPTNCSCRVGVWDLSARSGGPVAIVPVNSFEDLRWNGDEFAVLSSDGVQIYRLAQLPLRRGLAPLVVFSADGSTFASVNSDPDVDQPTVTVYDAEDVAQSDALPTVVLAVDYQSMAALSPNGEQLAIAGDGGLEVFDVATGEAVLSVEGAYTRPSFGGSGRILVALRGVGANPGEDGFVFETYDTQTWTLMASAPPNAPSRVFSWIFELQWLNDESIVTVSDDGASLRVTTFSGGSAITQERPLGFRAVDVWSSGDGSLVAFSLENSRMVLFPGLPEAGDSLASAAVIDVGDSFPIYVSFSSDGSRMLTNSGSDIVMWDVSDLSDLRRLGQLGSLPAVVSAGVATADFTFSQFSRDGRTLLLAGGGSVMRLPDFDPAGVCAAATEADLLRTEAILGNESACRRIPALRSTG